MSKEEGREREREAERGREGGIKGGREGEEGKVKRKDVKTHVFKEY